MPPDPTVCRTLANRGAGQRFPLKAALSFAMSSFFIFSIAAKARSAPGDSSCFNIFCMPSGVTCHERPNRSLSHPQTCAFGSPPSESRH